ncbi:aldose 1-epimerase [Parasediminibacterium sp. JCM 36343]|uniref:aldose 1-epimerase n=1 Tax=Parasediminibacterium sp. JCM 36343 TaxID=3374279 RepID=UPI00397B0EA5
MYTIAESLLAGHQMLTLTHIPSGNYASIIVGYGGAINSFVVNGKHILTSASNADEFEKITKNSFAGAQLFPFVNRVKNATFTIDGQAYSLPMNDGGGLPHCLHGLVYNQTFTIVERNEQEGILKLEYHFAKKIGSFPFEYLLEVTYTLDEHSLQVDTVITNLGGTIAPIGYGWHPYIAVDGKIDDCKLQLPATKYYTTDEQLIPTGETNTLFDFVEPSPIGHLELNQCFEMRTTGTEHSTMLEDGDGTCIQLIQNGFAYTQYYIPPDRKSIAIEPQTSIPDALNNGIGLLQMQPNQAMEFSFKIIVSRSHKGTKAQRGTKV